MSRVLFPRPPPSYSLDSFPGELIWVPRSLNPQTSSPEDCIPLCLLRCRSARYLVIYIHSNFEDIGRCHNFCLSLRYHLRVHVLAVEYPGYGISPGSCCDEQGATESAHVALRFAHEVLRWPWDSIILLGRSIGTGPATALAAKHRFGGLVLVCPFLSVRELCREYIGAAAGFIRERFPNKDLITQVRAPCLFIHGKKDAMIPHRHSLELHDACVARKRLVSHSEMEHNTDLLNDESYLIGPMRDFFALPGERGMDMQVPRWAFDKQLSPGFVAVAPPPSRQRVACSLLGAPCACPGACSQCGVCRGTAGSKVVLVEPVRASCGSTVKSADLWVVEETIVGAVEYSLEHPEGGDVAREQQGWVEEQLSPSALGLATVATDPSFGHRMAHILQRAEEVAGEVGLGASLATSEKHARARSCSAERIQSCSIVQTSIGKSRGCADGAEPNIFAVAGKCLVQV